MKFKKNTMFIIILIIVMAVPLYSLVSRSVWWILAFGSSPQIVEDMKSSLNKLPSDVLISKLASYNRPYSFFYRSPYPYLSLRILIDRKEQSAVPVLISFLKMQNKDRRQTAIWALGVFNDERAVEPLMEIVKKGEENPDYDTALMALARMKYQDAFPYVLKIAKKDFPKNCAAANLLQAYGNTDCVPILLEI